MPTKKRITNKRKNRKNKSRKQKGGCDCGKSIMGGSPFLTNVPPGNYYVLKNEAANPNTPGVVVSSRLLGGSKKRRQKKQKGGMSFSFIKDMNDVFLGNGTTMNAITSFGSVAGVSHSDGLMRATPYTNSAPFVQPVSEKFGWHNPPLV